METHQRIMIFSYLTKQYLNNAILFLNSFKIFNGTSEFIYLKVIGADTSKLDYPNLYIDYEEYSALKINYSQEEEYQCLLGKGDTIWKKYVADEHRILEFQKVVKKYDFPYYIFLDIDLLFCGNILDMASSCKDITIRYRDVKKNNGKFAIGFIVFPKNRVSFVDKWIKEIQSVPLAERKVAHGQLAFYNCIDSYDNLLPQFLDKKMSDDSIVWTPNRGNRLLNYQKFIKKYEACIE